MAPIERFPSESNGGPKLDDIVSAVQKVGERRGILEHFGDENEGFGPFTETFILGQSDEDAYSVHVVGESVVEGVSEPGVFSTKNHLIAHPDVIAEVLEELAKIKEKA